MGVLHALYETYETYKERAGIIEIKTIGNKDIPYTLLPMAHTTQTAHIEVRVTEAGQFHSASVIDKKSTVLPFTENSGSRAGKALFPHVLHDKLMYTAGDFVKYTGQEDKVEAFTKYLDQLQAWVESSYSHPDIISIYEYVKKGSLIGDLVAEGILHLDEQQQLLATWNSKEDKPSIFQMLTGSQESAFVRFRVHSVTQQKLAPWENPDIFNCYTQFYSNSLEEMDWCYILGKQMPKTTKHPNKIRNSGDKGKLISANDKDGFTYRGRFLESTENASISYEASQKIHNALKWLIDKQGAVLDGRIYLVWGAQELAVPHFMAEADLGVTEDDDDDLLLAIDAEINTTTVYTDREKPDTNELLAKKFRQRLIGLNPKFDSPLVEGQEIHILTLDAATTGRLGILSYRNFDVKTYFDRLATYQTKAAWYQSVLKDKKGEQYIQAPSLRDIAAFVSGRIPNEKVVKLTIERLIPTVLDDRAIPLDIVKKAVSRACNPHSFEYVKQFQQGMEIACAIIKHHYYEEGYTLTLNEKNKNRSYTYGRLLAVADALEKAALYDPAEKGSDKRSTNALRYMQAMQMQPARTWETIYKNLQPYRQKLKTTRYEKLFQEILDAFSEEEYMSNKSLDGRFVLGYYHQQKDLYTKKEQAEDKK